MGTQTKKTNKYMSLAAVTLAFSFTFLSRYIWSPLMADVSGEFGINATQAGLYMSAFFAGYLVTQIPGGIMADKYQPKYILIACTVLGGAMTALMSAINSYEMGLAIRVVTGVSSGCVMAQCSKVVALTFAPKERASAMGVVLASPPFGITLAQSLGAPLNQAFGWRITFMIVGAVAAVIVVLLAVFVQPVEKKVPEASAPKAAAQTAAAKAPGTGQAGMLEGLVGFFTNKQQLLLGASGFMFMFISVGFATWTNKYVQSIGFQPCPGWHDHYLLQHCRHYRLLSVRKHCPETSHEPPEFPYDDPCRHGCDDHYLFYAEKLHRTDSDRNYLWCGFLSAFHSLHHLCHDAGRRAFYSNCRLHTEPVVPDGKPDYAYHCRTGN